MKLAVNTSTQRIQGMNECSTSERWLVLLLRVGGIMTLCAFFAVFLPVDSMAAAHAWLGLGEFPASAIADYLTRSLSAMYAFHGGILLILSTDVRRFRALIRYVAVATAALGILLLGIDLHAGMPGWWTALEGPPVVLLGMLLLWLLRKVPSDAVLP